MVRACRQQLTTTQDEIDAFAFVMLAIELEREKRAEHDAVKSTEHSQCEQQGRKHPQVERNAISGTTATERLGSKSLHKKVQRG